MAGVEENNRPRLALVLGALGVFLVIFGLVLVVQQIEQISSQPIQPAAGRKSLSNARAIQSVLFLLLVLVGIFAVASLAFVRWSRRYRRWLMHKPQAATPNADVWAMHRLPEEDADNRQDIEFGPPADDGAGDTDPKSG